MAKQKNICLALMAHVDAGKTTLAEGILYLTGSIDRQGRVDHGDTALDTESVERERGITVFSKQAVFKSGNTSFTLLDTPGHADFSSEMERTLSVLDCAVLVISGTASVQAHTYTLWELLKRYDIPVFVFVSKMDLPTAEADKVLADLQKSFHGNFIDFSKGADPEALAECDEALMDAYFDGKPIADELIAAAVERRNLFPVYFGSGLRLEGIEALLTGLDRYALPEKEADSFSARVFKISRDRQGNRLTYLKLTGGTLKVRQSLAYTDMDGNTKEEKITQIRIYNGAKFEAVSEIGPGAVAALTGLSGTWPGEGLGLAQNAPPPMIEPALSYRIILPEGGDPQSAMPSLLRLQDEDPLLSIVWNSRLGEIHVRLMGETQIEVLEGIINERFGLDVKVGSGSILYKETIASPALGAGHFEPLRHYAEVHLLLEPLPRGSGLQFATICSEDVLDLNWQRLILTHLEEKQHLGVLTGSPITDMRITLTSGRAHLKHTEGGDFRQATYRAIRQGLMKAESVLLEPYYEFSLEVPNDKTGRAINDIRAMSGEFDCVPKDEQFTLIKGTAPVDAMRDYLTEVLAYTGGKGRLSCRMAGYMPCHNAEKVIAAAGYDPVADIENTPDSVFCSHGAGVNIRWNEADRYMHMESGIKPPHEEIAPALRRYNLDLDEKELEEIMVREFGPIKRPMYRKPDSDGASSQKAYVKKQEYIIVDGYNVIFAWDWLKEESAHDLAMARAHLINILSNYCGYTGSKLVLVFDGYAEKDNPGEKTTSHGINVVYTKQAQTGDMYIEKLASDIGRNYSVRVVTSDNLIRLSALRSGVLRTSAADFIEEIDWVYAKIRSAIEKKDEKHTLGDTAKIVKKEE